jgi:hypothetical protein
MSKKILSLLILVICLFSLAPAADPFYTNLLNEGKQLYLAGKLDEALENFKIAEFGLIDEKEIVPELYYYFALTQYKKGALTECQGLLDKLKIASGESNVDKLTKPKEIERDLAIMTRALDYLNQPGAKPGFIPFLNLFYEIWELLKAKKLPEAQANLDRLDKMKGDEARLYFLEGLLAFQKEDYKKCIKQLEKIDAPLPAEFSEDVSFYLAFSYLKRDDNANGEKYAHKIKNPDFVHRLMALMDEIKARQQIDKNKKK